MNMKRIRRRSDNIGKEMVRSAFERTSCIKWKNGLLQQTTLHLFFQKVFKCINTFVIPVVRRGHTF